MTTLLFTQGTSWQILPETLGLLAPCQVPLFSKEQVCPEFQIDEVWIATTDNATDNESELGKLHRWYVAAKNIGWNPGLWRLWICQGISDILDEPSRAQMRELILRMTLHACELSGGPESVIACLAGGRKTMSADLQDAAQIFGCAGLFHVIVNQGSNSLPKDLEQWLCPLSQEANQALNLTSLGRKTRQEWVDISLSNGVLINGSAFPLKLAPPWGEFSSREPWQAPAESLDTTLSNRQAQAASLFGNYLGKLFAAEVHSNWLSLYRLPPAKIDSMRAEILGRNHQALLTRMPKADLHCHIGGVLDLPAQIKVAQSLWVELNDWERREAASRAKDLGLQTREWPRGWEKRLKQEALRPAICAFLLNTHDFATLERHLWPPEITRFALVNTSQPLFQDSPTDFANFELPGELSGSAMLSDSRSWPEYFREIHDYAIKWGLSCLELRGSPQKYGSPKDFLLAFEDFARAHSQVAYGFLWIMDRRAPDQVNSSVEKLEEILEEGNLSAFLGIDLAGDETHYPPESFASPFSPLFRLCLPITIHAGEGQPAENIWQATYHLHAERIGHGLTLPENPQLLKIFRRRGVCVELCPTSNSEVVGYHDPDHPQGRETSRIYPLRAIWQAGIPVAICTDNPGICRTNPVEEMLRAARMADPPLNLWEVTSLLRTAFAHSFFPPDTRAQLLRQGDATMFQLLSNHQPQKEHV